MLTSKITTVLPHPDSENEPGITFTVRKLSHSQLMMSIDVRIDSLVKRAAGFGELKVPDDGNKELPTDSPEERERKTKAREEARLKAEEDAKLPENKYDRATVLRCGVMAWTYDVPPETGVADLDEDTAAWLFGEIIAFSVRSAADVKTSANGSLPTTDPAEVVGLPS